jgi:DNA replication and repair protein RecF
VLVWVGRIEVRDFRNIRDAAVDLAPGLNVFFGRNAQGKTSLLESVGLLARGRSFRTEETRSLIRRGTEGLWARARARSEAREATLEVRLDAAGRRLFLDGRESTYRDYSGRLEVVVYSTDRLRVIRGTMRDRRQFLDRSASVLWPGYRQALSEYERILLQRNASLERRARDLDVWTERLVSAGAALRARRGSYARRLHTALSSGFRPEGEAYGLSIAPFADGEEAHRRLLAREIEECRAGEQAARRTLAGPQRDRIALTIGGEDAALSASSGQARSLLLALTIATLDVHREETGEPSVALLDDLDSELDAERTAELARAITARGQALVTTAHRGWAERLQGLGPQFSVRDGAFEPMS